MLIALIITVQLDESVQLTNWDVYQDGVLPLETQFQKHISAIIIRQLILKAAVEMDNFVVDKLFITLSHPFDPLIPSLKVWNQVPRAVKEKEHGVLCWERRWLWPAWDWSPTSS